MAYDKMSFDGDNLKYYNAIKARGKTNVSEIYSYTKVADKIKSLYWEGSTKDEVCKILETIDTSCNTFYTSVNYNIKKTKIVYGVLGPELNLLKSKIEQYNSCIDEYNKTYSQLQHAINLQKNEGDKNG